METLGVLFLVLIVIIVLVGIIVVLLSLPDIRRYQRIRKM